jgi:hypothetical protein
MSELETQRRKLEETRREGRLWIVAQMRDNITPQQRREYFQLERSARVEGRLRQRIIEHLEAEEELKRQAQSSCAPIPASGEVVAISKYRR